MGTFLILAIVLAQVPQAGPPAQPDRVDRALELIHEQKYEMAYSVLMDLVKDDPTNSRAFPFLAAMELQTGRLADAENHINALVAHDPDNADLRELSAQLYMARRDWKKAEEQWRWIVAQRPNSEQAHMQLGAVLLQQDRYNDAFAEVSRALEISPKRSDARSLRGNILAALGQINQAALDWNIALVGDPDDTVALSGLAVFLRQTDPDQALLYAHRAVELTGWKSLGPMRVLAMVYRARAENELAKNVLQRALLVFPNNEALAAEIRGDAEGSGAARNPAAAKAAAAKPEPPKPAAAPPVLPPGMVTLSPLAMGGLTLGAAVSDLLDLDRSPARPSAVAPPATSKPADSAAVAKAVVPSKLPAEPVAPSAPPKAAALAPPPATPAITLPRQATGGLTMGAAISGLLLLDRPPSRPAADAAPAASKPADSAAIAKTVVPSKPPVTVAEPSAEPKTTAAPPPPSKPAPPAPAPTISVASVSPLAFGGLTLGAALGDLLPLEKLPSPPAPVARAATSAPNTSAAPVIEPPLAPAPLRTQSPGPDLHWGAIPLSTISPAFVYGAVPPPAAARRP